MFKETIFQNGSCYQNKKKPVYPAFSVVILAMGPISRFQA
jgi:hypothetical protein